MLCDNGFSCKKITLAYAKYQRRTLINRNIMAQFMLDVVVAVPMVTVDVSEALKFCSCLFSACQLSLFQ